MMFSRIINLFLGTTLSLFLVIPNHAEAKPIEIETQVNQTEYLAQNSSSNSPKKSRFRGQRLLEKLNLTTTQQEEIEKIQETYQPQISQVTSNLRSERDKLAEMMAQNEPTSNLRSQHQKIISLDQQVHNLRFESMLEMLKILTPEQHQEFAQIMGQKSKKSRSGFSNQ